MLLKLDIAHSWMVASKSNTIAVLSFTTSIYDGYYVGTLADHLGCFPYILEFVSRKLTR